MARKDAARKDQAETKGAAGDPGGNPGTREEARHLAQEAMQEMDRGNKDEAEFVLGEARDLDKAAVDKALKERENRRD